MGQYYIPTIMSAEGELRTLLPHDFDNGMKLMEHAYVENILVNAVLMLLQSGPRSVAWIGDYSDEPYTGLYSTKLCRDEYLRIYGLAWDGGDPYAIRSSIFDLQKLECVCTMNTKRKYLVNHTRSEYLCIGDYIHKNSYEWDGESWCISPLPLLTACGNGRGGGDFTGHGYEQAGLWAFDLLEYTEHKPEGYSPVMFSFQEKGAVSCQKE